MSEYENTNRPLVFLVLVLCEFASRWGTLFSGGAHSFIYDEKMQSCDLKCSWVELQGVEGHTRGNGIHDMLWAGGWCGITRTERTEIEFVVTAEAETTGWNVIGSRPLWAEEADERGAGSCRAEKSAVRGRRILIAGGTEPVNIQKGKGVGITITSDSSGNNGHSHMGSLILCKSALGCENHRGKP